MKFLARYKYQILLITIGLGWLLFLNALMQIGSQDNICNDCDNYRESARYLYHHFKTHYFRPIGMAMIVGVPYLFGATDSAIYSFGFNLNVLAWLGSALLLFKFLKRQLPPYIAFLGSLMFYSILSFVFINFNLLTESIFTFLMIAVFYLLDRYYSEKSFHYLSMAISILLFSMLVKPGAKFFALVVLVYFSRILLQNLRSRSMLLVYLSLSLIAFQHIKMKVDYGNYTLSYIDSVTYYNYLGAKANSYQTKDTLDPGNNKRARFLEEHSYPEQRSIATTDLIDQLKNNKMNLVKAYISNVADNTKSPNGSIGFAQNLKNTKDYESFKKWLAIISKYQNRFFTIIGFVLSAYYLLKCYRHNILYSFISCYILYTIAISGVSYSQGDRFHIVFFPLVIVLMAKFYNESRRKFFPKA